jgi:hypothetical protein
MQGFNCLLSEQEPGRVLVQQSAISVQRGHIPPQHHSRLLHNASSAQQEKLQASWAPHKPLHAKHAKLDTMRGLAQKRASFARLEISRMWALESAPHALLIPTVHLKRPSQALCCSSRGTLAGLAT